MRQVARHQGYAGTRATSSRHGFTLVEVVVASAILLVVSVAFLRFSITSYQWGQNVVIRSMAQNLAELTAEQLAGASVTEIDSMINVKTKAVSADFPINGTTWPDSLDPAGITVQTEPAGKYYAKVPGQFLVTGITSFFARSTSEEQTQRDSLSLTGIPSALEARPAQFSREGPLASDLPVIFPFALGDVPSTFDTYQYSAAPNVVIEPVKHVNPDDGSVTWDAGLVLFRGQFPRFLREVTVDSLFVTKPSDPTQQRYKYTVRVIWYFGGQRQMVALSGERSGVY